MSVPPNTYQPPDLQTETPLSSAAKRGRSQSAARRSRRREVLGLIFVLLLGIAVLAPGIVANLNRYRVARLAIGMSRPEVEAAVLGRPKCETRMGQATVLYFPEPVMGVRFECSELAAEYSDAEDVPLPYGVIVVVLSRERRVSAFWHVGEGPLRARSRMRTRAKNGVETLATVSLGELER